MTSVGAFPHIDIGGEFKNNIILSTNPENCEHGRRIRHQYQIKCACLLYRAKSILDPLASPVCRCKRTRAVKSTHHSSGMKQHSMPAKGIISALLVCSHPLMYTSTKEASTTTQ